MTLARCRIRLSCPVCTVSLSFHWETVDSHVQQSAAVRIERVELPFPDSESGVLPIERNPIVVDLKRFELLPLGVKTRCAAVTPQTQNGVRGCLFESVQHVVGELRIELRWTRRSRGLRPRQEPRLSARPRTPKRRRARRGFFLERAPRSLRLYQPTYESGSPRVITCLDSVL
jgi:hypothetical protein